MELKGKVINFLGDSITEGSGVSDIANCRYDNVIHREYGLAAHNNYGIGGTRLAYQKNPSQTSGQIQQPERTGSQSRQRSLFCDISCTTAAGKIPTGRTE